jgi:hypothetical protein
MLLTLSFAMIALVVAINVLWKQSFPATGSNFFRGKVVTGNKFSPEYIPGSSFLIIVYHHYTVRQVMLF